MGQDRIAAVVSADGLRRETISRAFVAAGFQVIAAEDVAGLAIDDTKTPLDVVLDERDTDSVDAALAALKERCAVANVWGFSETTALLAHWGGHETGARASAESMTCEGVLDRARRGLQPTGAKHVAAHDDICQAKQELETILDGSPDVVFVCSEDNRIVRGNRALFAKLGEPPGEVLGRPCYEVLHGCSSAWPGCLWPKVLEADGAVTWTLDGLSFPGTYECTAFTVELGANAVGLAHYLREVRPGAAG